jgi:hypothetical protein
MKLNMIKRILIIQIVLIWINLYTSANKYKIVVMLNWTYYQQITYLKVIKHDNVRYVNKYNIYTV